MFAADEDGDEEESVLLFRGDIWKGEVSIYSNDLKNYSDSSLKKKSPIGS